MRLQVGVQEVLEVRQPVPGRHLEQPLGVGVVPVEIGRDVVRRDGEGEGAALGIAGHHDLDVGAVDHVHLGLEVAVGERHLLAAKVGDLLAQVGRAGPVEGQVGEGRLRAPAAGHVQVVDQLLHGLLDRRVRHGVVPHERGHVGVERAERLRAGPLVLQRAEEVDDLADGRRHMARRRGLHLARHAVEALGQQLAQGPSRAVARQHVEIVDVQVALAMRVPGLGAVDVREPVVGGDLAGHVQDQAAQAVALVGVGVDAPVALLEILVHRALDVDQRVPERAQAGVLLTVDDIGARRAPVAGHHQGFLDMVLDGLDARAGQPGQLADHVRAQALRFLRIEFVRRPAGCRDGLPDLLSVERRQRSVALGDLRARHGVLHIVVWSQASTRYCGLRCSWAGIFDSIDGHQLRTRGRKRGWCSRVAPPACLSRRWSTQASNTGGVLPRWLCRREG